MVRIAQRVEGDEVRQISHYDGNDYLVADFATGAGLLEALRDVEVLVHTASSSQNPWDVDVLGARRLAEAVDRASLRHLVYVSIVGVDRIPVEYYHAKFAAEQVLRASGLPVTVVRSTQFHAFVDDLLRGRRKGPVLAVPTGWRLQPVDVDEVAERLWEIALGDPTDDVLELGGPEEIDSKELARLWAEQWTVDHPEETTPKPRVLPVRLPGKTSAAFREGFALPGKDAWLGRTTYADHLAHAAAVV